MDISVHCVKIIIRNRRFYSSTYNVLILSVFGEKSQICRLYLFKYIFLILVQGILKRAKARKTKLNMRFLMVVR